MKSVVRMTALLLLLGSLCQVRGQERLLTNDDIIKLVKAGLSEDVIKATIKSRSNRFDLSPDKLIRLKGAKVPGPIIRLMIERSVRSESGSPAQPLSTDHSDNPLSLNRDGIYYIAGEGPPQRLESITAEVKAGSGLMTGLTFGVKKTKGHAELPGGRAAFQIPEPLPAFYVLPGESSIRNVKLLRLEQKKGKRRFQVYSVSGWGSSDNLDKKQLVQVGYEQVREGVYRLLPERELQPGEYAFVFADVMVWDFGIIRGK